VPVTIDEGRARLLTRDDLREPLLVPALGSAPSTSADAGVVETHHSIPVEERVTDAGSVRHVVLKTLCRTAFQGRNMYGAKPPQRLGKGCSLVV